MTEDMKRYLREEVSEIPKHMLRPVSNKKGMRDYINKTVLDVGSEPYKEYRWWILENSRLMEGGKLLPDFSPFYQDRSRPDGFLKEAFLMFFEKYLCTDGVIRYVPSDEVKNQAKAFAQKNEDEWWDDFNESLEAQGYIYSEEEGGCWVNAATGDTICY